MPPEAPETSPLDQAWELLQGPEAAVGKPPISERPGVPGTVVDEGPSSAFDLLPKTGEELTSMGVGPAMEVGKEVLKEQGVPQNAEELGTFFGSQMERAKTPMNVRGMLRGGGAAAGGMAGAPFGPGGVMAGTGAGSALGSYLANVYDSLHQSGEKPALLESYMRPLQDGLTDATITGGGQVVLPMVTGGVKTLLSKLLRLPPNSKELLKEASDIGVDIGVANVAQSGPGRGVVNTLGRVPIVGGSAQNAARNQARQLTAAANDLFGEVAQPRVASEVSREAYETGLARFTDFALKTQKRFEHASRVGDEAGPIVPSGKIAAAATSALEGLKKMDGGISVWLGSAEQKFLKSLAAREGPMTTNDVKNIDFFLENVMRKADSKTNVTHPLLGEIRAAASKAMGSVDHPAAKLMAAADAEFIKGMKTFGTETAKTVGKIERNVYATGQVLPGKKTPEEMLETVQSLNTTDKIRNMRDIAGDDIVKQAARVRLDQAWNRARVSEEGQPFKWSADKFNKDLGIDNPNGPKYEAMKEMLKGTGVNIDDIAKLSRVAETVANAPIADVSTFMARAAMLRGAGGFTEALKGAVTLGLATGGGGAAGGAKGAGAGLLGSLATMYMARIPVGAMMKPGTLRALTSASDVEAPVAARASALLHLYKSDPSTWGEIIDDYHQGGQDAVAPR